MRLSILIVGLYYCIRTMYLAVSMVLAFGMTLSAIAPPAVWLTPTRLVYTVVVVWSIS